MKVEDGKLVIPVSTVDFRQIDQAMMLKKRGSQQLGQTDGEVLAGVCGDWLCSRGVDVEKPSEED